MGMLIRAAFLVAVAAAAVLAGADVQRIAVFIGVDRGLQDETPLRYAARDARGMAEAFRGAGTFDEDRIYLLANPSLEKIKATLEEVKGRVRELRRTGTESLVLLYFSGHGGKEGLHIQGRKFPRQELSGYLESLESNLKILILDACESGGFLRSKGGRVVDGPKVVKLDRLESKGTVLISSSSPGEMAQESEDYRGAVFTHHFLNGLRGLADYDGDKSIRLMEAFDYARVSTRREEIWGQASRQNPEFDFDMRGEADPVLARLGSRNSLLLLDGMPSGPLEIYDGGTMQLETKVWLTGQDSLSFSLPSGKYILAYSEKQDETRVLELDLTWKKQAAVRPDYFRRKTKSLLQGKGGRILDMHFNGFQASVHRADLFGGLYLTQADYVFRGFLTKQTLGFSFARTDLEDAGNRLGNALHMLGVGYSLRVPALRSRYGQILIGAQASYHRLFQTIEDFRFGEEPVAADGRIVDLEREYRANLYRAAAPLECEIYFPRRFWLSASAGPGLYFYNQGRAAESRVRIRFEPGLSLGHQF